VPKDSELVIERAVGESVVIRIPANPTTGYAWEIESCDSRLRCLELAYRRTSSRIGGGGIQRFEVTALEAGDFNIRFRLRRPWETEAKEVRTYRISARQK
jgi:inhibitor of cysteine peptidase